MEKSFKGLPGERSHISPLLKRPKILEGKEDNMTATIQKKFTVSTKIKKNLHKNQVLLDICNSCKKEKGISPLPVCQRHRYCSDCLNKNSHPVFKFCEDCSKFFKAVSEPIKKNVVRCATCLKFPNMKQFCYGHNYCKDCFGFFSVAGREIFDFLRNCRNCWEYFNSHLKDTRQTTPISKIKNSEAYLEDLTSKSSENQENLKKNIFSIVQVSFNDKLKNSAKQIVTRSSLQQFSKFLRGEEVKGSETERCSEPVKQDEIRSSKQQVDDFLRHEKSKETVIQKIEKSSKSIKMSRNSRPTTPDCLLDKKLTKTSNMNRSKSPIIVKLQLSSINMPKKERKDFIHNYQDIRVNQKTIDTPKFSKILRKKKSLFNISTECFHCNNENDVKSFLCNHNMCSECIIYTGISQIQSFFDLYSKDKRFAYFEFFFICPMENCFGKISIPCHMIVNRLDYFLQRKNERFEKFRNLGSAVWNQWDAWIPYFDGIGFNPQ